MEFYYLWGGNKTKKTTHLPQQLWVANICIFVNIGRLEKCISKNDYVSVLMRYRKYKIDKFDLKCKWNWICPPSLLWNRWGSGKRRGSDSITRSLFHHLTPKFTAEEGIQLTFDQLASPQISTNRKFASLLQGQWRLRHCVASVCWGGGKRAFRHPHSLGWLWAFQDSLLNVVWIGRSWHLAGGAKTL